VLFNKERLTLIALTLVALLLAGCGLFGSKSYDIVVRIDPPVEGVKIFVDGVHEATTEADGQVELNNVKANAKLTAELEGYTFKQKEQKVTKAGEYVFEIETSPGRKGAIVGVKTVLEDIKVSVGETPFEDLPLPSTVEVVLDDDEEVEVAVDWTAAVKDYSYKTARVYELEGVLVPGEGITNPDNITVKVKVVVDAEPTMIKVEADDRTYKSGETISLTLTLQYGDAKTLYTYNETSVVEVRFGTEEAPVYNRLVTFVDGVGTLDVDAWKAASTVTVKLKDVVLEGSASITVEPGDPEILEATIVGSNDIELTLQDKFEQTVTWFEAENMKVQLAVKDEGEEAVGGSSTSVTGASPDWDGVAFVSFVEGKATIEFDGSLYQTWLHEKYGAKTDPVKLIITLVVDEKKLTAEVDYKVPSS